MNFISSSECPSALIQTVNRLGIVPGSDTKCSSEIVFKQSILRHFTFTSTQHRDSLSVANIMTLLDKSDSISFLVCPLFASSLPSNFLAAAVILGVDLPTPQPLREISCQQKLPLVTSKPWV